MTKKKTVAKKKQLKILTALIWASFLSALVFPFAIEQITRQTCTQTLVGGCTMESSYPGIITAIVVMVIFVIIGILALTIRKNIK